jgi:hypothetical protein
LGILPAPPRNLVRPILVFSSALHVSHVHPGLYPLAHQIAISTELEPHLHIIWLFEKNLI